MNKQLVFRIIISIVGVVFFWVTLPFLFRVYLIVIPAIAIYFLLVKFDFFSNKKEHKENVIDITDDWKTKYWNSFSTGFIPAFGEFLWLVRKITWVLIGIILVAAVTLYFVVNNLKVSRTNTELTEIASEITVYTSRNNKLPDSLDEVIGRNPLKSSWKKDFWNNPIMYSKAANGLSYSLLSYGKDGQLNTEDDLVLKSN